MGGLVHAPVQHVSWNSHHSCLSSRDVGGAPVPQDFRWHGIEQAVNSYLASRPRAYPGISRAREI